MSFLSFLDPTQGYKAGEEQLQKYYDQAQGRLNPYAQGGVNAMGQLQGAMGSLLNPQQLQDQWSQGYKESPYAKQMQEKAMQQGGSAASAMGMVGSTTGLKAMQEGASNIVNQDRQNYMNRLMDMYKTGAGIGQGIMNTGAGAAGQMSQQDMNMGKNMGEMETGRKNAWGNLIGNIAGTALGMYGLRNVRPLRR